MVKEINEFNIYYLNKDAVKEITKLYKSFNKIMKFEIKSDYFYHSLKDMRNKLVLLERDGKLYPNVWVDIVYFKYEIDIELKKEALE